MRYLIPLIGLALISSGCGSKEDTVDELHTRIVTLPGGQKIRAEVEIEQADMQKGMMFRDSLAKDRGMLFIHDRPGLYPYWMFQCKIPLDMMWMDADHHIVEISAETPACTGPASSCPSYGGHQQASFVLELGGGEAKRLGLKVGDTLQF